jgi:hypothetical protein
MKCSTCKSGQGLVQCPRKVAMPYALREGCSKGSTHFRKDEK